MPSGKDLELNPYPSILLVGDSGTHKTFFLGTVPKIFIYDFDNSLSVIRGKNFDYSTFRDAPQGSKLVSPERGIYEWGTAYPRFLEHLNKLGEQIDKGTSPYEAIALDSLTFFGDIVLNYVLKNTNHGPVTPKAPVDPGEWGSQSRLMATVMDQLTMWPVIKLVTAHIQRDNNDITQVTEKLPLTTGKFAAKVSSYFDETYFCDIKYEGTKLTFIAKTLPVQGMKAKSRFGVPDNTELDWAHMGKYLLAGRNGAK